MTTPDLLAFVPLEQPAAEIAVPTNESKFKRFLNFFNTGYGSPGKFDDWNREFKDVSGTNDYFDGLKGETLKALGNEFNVTEGVQLGGVENSGTFNFITNYAPTENTVFVGSYSSEGRKVFGRFIKIFPNIGKNSTISLVGQVNKDEEDGSLKPMAVLEAEYNGSDNTVAVRIDQSSQTFSYLQTFRPDLYGGVEFTHLQPQKMNLFTGALRMDFKSYKTVFTGILSTMSGLTLNYLYNGKGYTAATEYTYGPTQTGAFESVFTGAVRYEFTASRYRFRANSKFVVGGLYEEQIADNMKLAVCADFDLIKPTYRFGLGFSFSTLPEQPPSNAN